MKEQDQFKTGFMTAAYRPECAKSSESVPKPEKVLIIAIFAIQMLFLQYKCYFFGVQNKTILSTQYKLLTPYGTSFAAVQTFATLWCKFCRLMTQYK